MSRIWRSLFLPPQHLPQPISSKYYWFYILNISVFPPHLIFLISTSLVQVIFLLLQPFLTGLPAPRLASLQSILHWVARVMFQKYKPGQVTPLYRSIQWPSVVFQINFNMSPAYLLRLISCHVSLCYLHSSHQSPSDNKLLLIPWL